MKKSIPSEIGISNLEMARILNIPEPYFIDEAFRLKKRAERKQKICRVADLNS